MKTAIDAGVNGIVSPQKIANALDMDIFELEDELDFADGIGFEERLKPLLSSYTMSKEDAAANDKGGRPQKSDSEITESGADTRASGKNIANGGSV